MKHFLVTIEAQIPYPFPKNYTIEASQIQTAIARGVREYRKDIGRKKVNELKVKAIKIYESTNS